MYWYHVSNVRMEREGWGRHFTLDCMGAWIEIYQRNEPLSNGMWLLITKYSYGFGKKSCQLPTAWDDRNIIPARPFRPKKFSWKLQLSRQGFSSSSSYQVNKSDPGHMGIYTYDKWHMSRQSFFVTPMEPQISFKKTAKKFKEPWLVSHTSLTLACHENKTVMIASLTSLELLVLFYAPAMSMGFIQLCPSASLWLIAIITAFLRARDTLWRWRYRVVGGDHHHHHHQQALMLGPQHLGDIRWQVPPPILLYPLHLRGWRSLVQSVALSCGRKPQLTTEVLTIPSEWLNSSSVVEGSSLYHDL